MGTRERKAQQLVKAKSVHCSEDLCLYAAPTSGGSHSLTHTCVSCSKGSDDVPLRTSCFHNINVKYKHQILHGKNISAV